MLKGGGAAASAVTAASSGLSSSRLCDRGAGEALEYGVILCTKTGDMKGFERNVQMLKPLYAGSRFVAAVPLHRRWDYDSITNNTRQPFTASSCVPGRLAALVPSCSEAPAAAEARRQVLGLYLAHLLVEANLPAFHAEVELLRPEDKASPYVAFVLQLENSFAEGAYNRVRDRRRGRGSLMSIELSPRRSAVNVSRCTPLTCRYLLDLPRRFSPRRAPSRPSSLPRLWPSWPAQRARTSQTARPSPTSRSAWTPRRSCSCCAAGRSCCTFWPRSGCVRQAPAASTRIIRSQGRPRRCSAATRPAFACHSAPTLACLPSPPVQPEFLVEGDVIRFEVADKARSEVDALALLGTTLEYATELERIV